MMDESSIMRALRLAMIPILTLTPARASSICATRCRGYRWKWSWA